MKHRDLNRPTAALLGGALCLAILGGMIVGHAWPRWTGETIQMRVTIATTHDARRGEHVALTMRENRLYLGPQGKAPADALEVTIGEGFWRGAHPTDAQRRALRGSVVYLQLEPDAEGVLRGASISRDPIPARRNLRGRVIWWQHGTDVFAVEYGVESLFVQQGTASEVVRAVAAAKGGRVDVALTGSGRARTIGVTAGERRW